MTVQFAPPSLALGRYAKSIAMGRGVLADAAAYAEGNREAWRDTPAPLLTLRAAVAAMQTGDGGGLAAAQTYGLLQRAIHAQELLSRIPNLRRVPLNVTLPAITGDATAYLVAEGGGKPLATLTTATVTVSSRKIVAAIIVTDELLRISTPAAETALGNELIKAVVAQADRQFVGGDFSTSIAAGATSIDSTGSTLAAVDADLKAMIAALVADGDGALDSAVFVMSARAAAFIASLRGSGGAPAFPLLTAKGGSLLGIPAYISTAMNSYDSPSESQILLLDATQILVSDTNEAAISVLKNASVQLSDAPTSAAAQLVSLWQNNMVALVCERWIGWARQSTSSVIVLDNVQFG